MLMYEYLRWMDIIVMSLHLYACNYISSMRTKLRYITISYVNTNAFVMGRMHGIRSMMCSMQFYVDSG